MLHTARTQAGARARPLFSRSLSLEAYTHSHTMDTFFWPRSNSSLIQHAVLLLQMNKQMSLCNKIQCTLLPQLLYPTSFTSAV